VVATTASGPPVTLPRTQVLVLDGHRMLAESLLSALSSQTDRFELCGPCSDIGESGAACDCPEPELVLLGLHGGHDLEQLASIRRLTDSRPDVRVVVISDSDDESEAVDMLESGAAGFITSTHPLSDLVALIERVLSGGPVILPDGFPEMLHTASSRRRRCEEIRRRMDSLTPREREVLDLMSSGLNDAEIAERLWISPRTVETHVHSVLRKLRAGSRLQAVVMRLRPDELGAEHAPLN
jgi:DNA-binding NarL/FixJ family response regulator